MKTLDLITVRLTIEIRAQRGSTPTSLALPPTRVPLTVILPLYRQAAIAARENATPDTASMGLLVGMCEASSDPVVQALQPYTISGSQAARRRHADPCTRPTTSNSCSQWRGNPVSFCRGIPVHFGVEYSGNRTFRENLLFVKRSIGQTPWFRRTDSSWAKSSQQDATCRLRCRNTTSDFIPSHVRYPPCPARRLTPECPRHRPGRPRGCTRSGNRAPSMRCRPVLLFASRLRKWRRARWPYLSARRSADIFRTIRPGCRGRTAR